MTTAGSLILVGPMGSGKSTIGRLLAARLRVPFVDSDAIILENTGVSINTIFEIEGEAGFRQRESRVIAELAAKAGTMVLATGGGAVLSAANREHLRGMGRVVYLDVSVEEQLKRLRQDRSRPLLQVADLEQRLRSMAEIRNPIYRETAHWRIKTDGLRADQVLRRILRFHRQAP